MAGGWMTECGYTGRCTHMAATKTYKGNCGRCGDQQVVQTKCACICGTCGAYQDALPEQDTQIQEAVEVQRTWCAVIVYVTYPTLEE